MKDAIIVRKVTAYLVMKGRIGEKEMKRRVELFLIILLPILGLVFLGGKIMTLTKRPETEDNKHFFKESCTKIKGRNKKRANRLSKRARARNRRFCESSKSEN